MICGQDAGVLSCSRNARPVGKGGVSAPPGGADKNWNRPSFDARNREHSRPLARQPLSRRLEGRKEEKGRGWSGWDDFLGTVEVAITTPLLFWPLNQMEERGVSYELTIDGVHLCI